MQIPGNSKSQKYKNRRHGENHHIKRISKKTTISLERDITRYAQTPRWQRWARKKTRKNPENQPNHCQQTQYLVPPLNAWLPLWSARNKENETTCIESNLHLKSKNHIRHCRRETQRKGIGIYSRNRSRDQVIRTVSNAFAEIKEKRKERREEKSHFLNM